MAEASNGRRVEVNGTWPVLRLQIISRFFPSYHHHLRVTSQYLRHLSSTYPQPTTTTYLKLVPATNDVRGKTVRGHYYINVFGDFCFWSNTLQIVAPVSRTPSRRPHVLSPTAERYILRQLRRICHNQLLSSRRHHLINRPSSWTSKCLQ